MKMSAIHRFIQRVQDGWRELDYAQQRMFEIRTGIDLGLRPPRRRAQDELEALYAARARPTEDRVPAQRSHVQ